MCRSWHLQMEECDPPQDSTQTPIYGKDGLLLGELWQDEPGAYMSLCPPSMPNCFFFVGPNGTPGAGSTIQMSEVTCEYMIKCILKLQRENLKWMKPKDSSVAAFMKQVDRYFEKTTFAFTCNNWAKRTLNGRMIGYWPGSAVHQRATLAHPRFKDFDYESNETDEIDSLAWMGNGMIMAQELNTSTTGYLDTVDKPPVLANPKPANDNNDNECKVVKRATLGAAGCAPVNGVKEERGLDVAS